jgi:hypothetical protein
VTSNSSICSESIWERRGGRLDIDGLRERSAMFGRDRAEPEQDRLHQQQEARRADEEHRGGVGL